MAEDVFSFSSPFFQVLSWGSGPRGELGLGAEVTQRLRPTPLPDLRRVSVTSLSAGRRHCLARTDEGFLYSWGCGKDGRLGHNDYNDRCARIMHAHAALPIDCASCVGVV